MFKNLAKNFKLVNKDRLVVFRKTFGLSNYKLFTSTKDSQGEVEFEAPKFKTNLNDDYEIAKKQVFWRLRNIGQKELEYLIMKWYDDQNMNLEELKKFSEEILEMENPEMNKYFVNFQPAPSNLVYTQKIQKYFEINKLKL